NSFIRHGKDVFYFYTDPNTYASKYINADQQRDYGFEAEASWHFSSELSASFNYTFTDGKIATENAAGKDTSYFNLYKRPKNVLNFSVTYQPLKKLFFSTNLKTVSKAFEPQYNAADAELKGYYSIGFYGDYKLDKRFTLFADLENVTNQKYFVTRGFTTKGFNWNTGLKAAF
ncbi:MAG TPA: TonB-dependent receptor, partial [Hanamia sp.]|nr:TonB-dependent receptor [Hanamia sp.]